MASKTEDIEKFILLLNDVENFYSDKIGLGDSHKARALHFFSQDEIDHYCQVTFSLAAFQKYKPYYQEKLQKAQSTFETMKPKFEKAKKTLEEFEQAKSDKLKSDADKLSSADIENMDLDITVRKLLVDKYHTPMGFCLDEINETLAKLNEGERLSTERVKVVESLKTKWASQLTLS